MIAGATGDVDVWVAWVWAPLLLLLLLLCILGYSSLDERRNRTKVDGTLQEITTSTFRSCSVLVFFSLLIDRDGRCLASERKLYSV